MKLYVNQKEMPSNCKTCDFLTEACGGRFCRVGDIVFNAYNNGNVPTRKRHKDCPLQTLDAELPPLSDFEKMLLTSALYKLAEDTTTQTRADDAMFLRNKIIKTANVRLEVAE